MVEGEFYRVDVTPFPYAGSLAGFNVRSESGEALGPDKLFLDIALFSINSVNVAFICFDTLYFPKKLASFLRGHLFDYFNIVKENVVFSATHTHSAPNVSWEYVDAIDEEYLKLVEKKLRIH